MKFDENLAAVHAYLCADGYVIKNPITQKQKYYVIGFRNTNLVLLENFRKVFYQYFGVKPHLISGQRCRIGSKILYEELTKYFGSFYSWEWSMPKLDQRFTRIWLRAYFDCDGWVFCKSHQNRMIGLDCVNIHGLSQIKKALFGLGISSIIKKRSTRNIFSLGIYGRNNLIKFNEKIGFLHPDKKEKLETALRDYVNYDWIFPMENSALVSFVSNLIKSKAKIKRPEGIFRIISNKENNLLKLQEYLIEIYSIESKINRRVNGIGTSYFQLNINKKSEVNKLMKYGLITEEYKQEWLKLRR